MKRRRNIVMSIISSMLGLLVFHTGFFLFIVRSYGISGPVISRFLLSTVIIHLSLLVFLLFMRRKFYIIPSSHRLVHVNIANLLTMYRLTATPTILFLLILNQRYPLVGILLIFTSAAFLTDLLDGLISRKTGQTTMIGQYLDSMADYAVLTVVSIAFVYYGLISNWFFTLVLARLLTQFASQGFLLLYQGHVRPIASPLGKASIFVTMTLYALAILSLFEQARSFSLVITRVFELGAAGVIIASIVEKGFILHGEIQRARRRKMFARRAQQAEAPPNAGQ
ncbi:MAG: CDP-alcohol phosphatidyltransferase family protein [Spirochaetaceae bacterium]|nr:MAG: CDP-alcohol phosphatidyltransferase family protein [Spirochaetaceae bacterium]